MNQSYLAFVRAFRRTLDEARSIPWGGLPSAAGAAPGPGAPVTLVFSPHPDDECIIGALPLRLRREAGHRVVVAAVTLGSDPARRGPRLAELRDACGYLGFEVLPLGGEGLTGITPAARAADPAAWGAAVERAREALEACRPAVVVLPHELDGHPTHAGTSLLAQDALAASGLDCAVVQTEFWHPLEAPTLMVESSDADVADLVAAISFHRGEVARNPYHVLLPSWMSDNVRRGSERVGSAGAAAAPFAFATLYRHGRWSDGVFRPAERTTLPAALSASGLFR